MKRAAVASVAMPLIVPRLSFAAPPSGKLQHAAIGVNGQGGYDLSQIFSSGKVDVIALCDVDSQNLEKAKQTYPGARLYRDWREMLEQEEKNIDSVSVGIPDHMHAPASMTAIRKGKHVFCEKPLTHYVHEARALRLAAAKKGVATQMGNQIQSHDFYRTAVHWMKEGAIGKVTEWYSWAGAHFPTGNKLRPEGSDPIPPTLDWDLWLGGAPERPFKAEREVWFSESPDKPSKQAAYHPFWWRTWRDFGDGATGDFGCHIFDPIFTALQIGAPLTVTAEVESNCEEFWPEWAISKYVFTGAPLTAGKTINATWLDGLKKPDASVSPHLPRDYAVPPSGSIVIGEDGTLVIPHVGAPELHPVEKFVNYPKPALEPLNHYHAFVEAALGNGVCGSNFDYAGPMTEAVLLSNIAGRFPGQTLEWDASRIQFTNNREANRFLRGKYRRGWRVRGL